MNAHTHKLHIVQRLLNEDCELTATDFHYISNANQYFCELEKIGILKNRWGYKGNTKVKFRSIADHGKALKFLGKKLDQTA